MNPHEPDVPHEPDGPVRQELAGGEPAREEPGREQPAAELFREPDPPFWARREVAWPLSLAAGFGGTLIGLQVPVPGLAALLATVAFLPLYIDFQRRGRLEFATFLGLGWMVGIGAACVGAAVEGQIDRLLYCLPGGQWGVRNWGAAWVPGDGAAAAPRGGGLPQLLGFTVFVVTVARVARGTLLFALLALGTGVVGAIAAWVADRASRVGEAPITAGALGLAPGLVVVLVGLLVAGSALADPAPLAPWSGWRAWRRKALLGGLAAALFGVAAHTATHQAWARWVAAQLGG